MTMILIDKFSTGDLSSNNLYPSIIKVDKRNNMLNEISIKARVYNDLGDNDTLDTRDFSHSKFPETKNLSQPSLINMITVLMGRTRVEVVGLE